jgi:hypothetical protein
MFTARGAARASAEGPGRLTTHPLKLAVGAVSRAAVDAACDVAAFYGRPIYIVASRAQVGSFPTRSGYVEGWCMADLNRYLLETGRRSHALVVRDHGGPLQHPEDGPADRLQDALNSACDALIADVKAGADGIHLDLGAWVKAGGSASEGLRRLVEACEEAATDRTLEYEIGVDPQSAEVADPAEVEAQLELIHDAVPKSAAVAFVVLQCGTLVSEDRNIGVLESPAEEVLRKIELAATATRRIGALPKAHNCDYLSPWALRNLGRAGVYCNIAPQYAVLQNRLFARHLDMYATEATRGRFVDCVRANGGWRRWTAEPEPSAARVVELGAHYVMSDEAVRGCLSELECSAREANLPDFEGTSRRILGQLMLQHAATVEGVGAPCR